MTLRLQPVDLGPLGWDETTKQKTNIENGVENSGEIITSPLDKLSTVSINGSGVFDILMRAAKQHLNEEYEAQRITGKEYATVYLGMISAVLQTSVSFLMNEQQVNLINAQIGLIRQQTVTELTNTCDSIPVGLGFNHVPLETPNIDPLVNYQGDAQWL